MVTTYFYTRFGVGIADKHWWEYRLRLFRAITFPSVTAHLSPDTKWIIFIDAKMDKKALQELHKLVDSIELSSLIRLEPIHVYPEVPGRLAALVRNEDEVRLLRMDDDDAISDDFFDSIPNAPGLYTLPNGFEVDLQRRELRTTVRPYLSHNTVYHGSTDSVEEYAKLGHHIVRDWALKKQIPHQEIASSNKTYIYSRHRQSDSNFAAVRKSIAEDARKRAFTGKLQKLFNIDQEQFLEWRRFTRSARIIRARKTWSINEQALIKSSQVVSELHALNREMRANTQNLF